MIGFNSAFGRKARKFAYRPRHYDGAAKERAGRKGVSGSDSEGMSIDGQKQYVPGEYVRANASHSRRFQGRGRLEQRRVKALRRTIIFAVLAAMAAWIVLTI